MTMIHTESFMAFDRLTVDDTYTPDNVAIRRAVADNLRTAGYDVVIGAYSSAATSNGFIIRPDPVAPDRAALVFSPGVGASSVGAAVRKTLPIQSKAIIGGFSLYVPQEFVPNTGVAQILRVNAVAGWVTDADWNVSGGGGAAGTTTAMQVFSVCSDLKIRMLTLNQSARALSPGRMHFLEFRIADNEVRVWLDDVLVLQHTTRLIPESIALQFYTNTAANATQMAGAAGRWAISNFYVVAEDDRAPNVRLGPTTRIIGVRPSSDVDVDFQRPAGFDSNAQIAAQSIVANPTQSLQAINVGDQDVYAAAGDISTPNAKMVHGIATKVMVSNLEAVPHRARALIRSATGTEQVDPKTRELKIVPGQVANGTRDFWHCAMRPTDNAIFMCGSNESIYKTPPNGVPGSPWSMVADGPGTAVYRTIAFRTDGTGVLGRSDGKIQVIAPGSNTPGPVINPGAATNAAIISGIIVTPDGAFTMTATTLGRLWRCEGDPSVPANWVLTAISGITTSMGLQRPSYAPASNKMMILSSTGIIRISSDMGKTWADPGLAARQYMQVDLDQVASDGSRFFWVGYMGDAGATSSAYSPDGVTWPQAITGSATMNMVGMPNAGGIATAYVVFGAGGVFVVIGDAKWYMSADPLQGFRRTNPIAPFGGTVNYPRGACVAYNGDWIFACTFGWQLAYTSQEFDVDMAPLAGYKLAFNASTINPDTGVAWTPAEATQAQFGVRVTS